MSTNKTGNLEHRIRQLDGVVSCQLTETEVVVMLTDGADMVVVAAAVGRVLGGSRPVREVRLMGGSMPKPGPARSALAAWVVAGLLAATVIGLAIALAVGGSDSSTTAAPIRTSLVPATSVVRTTATPATSAPVAVGPTAPPATAAPAPAATPPYAITRRVCRQDGTTLTAGGTILNQDGAPHSYRVTADFVNGSGQPVAGGNTEVLGVAPGQSRSWTVQVGYAGNLRAQRGSCRVGTIEVIG